jgi:pimeloyl-ACP methyl ester carboxylesterase
VKAGIGDGVSAGADGAAAERRGAQPGQSGAWPGRSPSASKTAKHRLHVTCAMVAKPTIGRAFASPGACRTFTGSDSTWDGPHPVAVLGEDGGRIMPSLPHPWTAALIGVTLALSPCARAAEAWGATPLPGPMPAPVEEGRVELPGASLHYSTYGDGAPLLLLHGGAGNGEHWAFQVPALARRFRVIVLDARGHGRSTRDDRPFGYHRMAEDLVAVMDALRIAQAAVVGWSDGGIVGLDVAVHHPERVTALVAFGANFDRAGFRKGGPTATFAAYMRRCEEDYRRLSPTPDGFPPFLAALRVMWRSEPSYAPAQLARIRARTLVLDGEHDEILRQDHARALARHIPGASVLFIPAASHFAHWQRPEAFNEAVLEFLGEKT